MAEPPAGNRHSFSRADIVREYPHLSTEQVAAAIDDARSKVSNPAEAAE